MNYKASHTSGEKQIVTVFAMNPTETGDCIIIAIFIVISSTAGQKKLAPQPPPNFHPPMHLCCVMLFFFLSLSLQTPCLPLSSPSHSFFRFSLLHFSLFPRQLFSFPRLFNISRFLLPPLLLAFFPPSLLPSCSSLRLSPHTSSQFAVRSLNVSPLFTLLSSLNVHEDLCLSFSGCVQLGSAMRVCVCVSLRLVSCIHSPKDCQIAYLVLTGYRSVSNGDH